MSKKKTIIPLVILICIAIVFGFILVNKGDGPIMGSVLSDKLIRDEQEYKQLEASKNEGIYIITSLELNKFVEKYKTGIPQNKDLYVTINLVECRKGTKILLKWIYNNNVMKEEIKTLTTDQKGIISYQLEGIKVKKGNYIIEAYHENKKIFSQNFDVN